MFKKTFQHILYLTLFAITTINAQILDSALVGDSTKILNRTNFNEDDKPLLRYENGMKVTYENGIKLVGEKTFSVAIEGDTLYVFDIRIGGISGYHHSKIDFKHDSEELMNPDISSKDIKELIYANCAKNQNPNAFIVFENAILEIRFDAVKEIYTTTIIPADGSKLFLHDGAIYSSSNCSIVATTPTTLLVITPNDMLSVTYESLFGKIPPFKKPTISRGRNPDEAFIRDETMRNDTNAVRLELDMKTLDITVKKDID